MEWRELAMFRGVDLHDSFVLSWACQGNRLVFELELSLWPLAEKYRPPKPDEYTCYRRASLVFHDVVAVRGLKEMASAIPSSDSDGSLDYGNIDGFTVIPTGFHLVGDFGDVLIECGDCRLEFLTEGAG